jgi:hypothetical protein
MSKDSAQWGWVARWEYKFNFHSAVPVVEAS